MKVVDTYNICEATQWNKIGDHPDVEPYGNLDGVIQQCRFCNKTTKGHGYFASRVICPGDWIIVDGFGNVDVCSDEEFKEGYKSI